jgi:hypothetical protein
MRGRGGKIYAFINDEFSLSLFARFNSRELQIVTNG